MSRAIRSILIACLICSLSPLAHAAVPVYRVPSQPAATLADLPADQIMTGFANEVGKPAPVQTRAAAFIKGGSLVFIVECLEPQMKNLVAKCQQDDEGAIFADDCIELFLSPGGEPGDYYHFATNALGARYDEKGRGNPTWDGKWTSKVTRGADRWTVELDLPLATLGRAPRPGSVWWLNLCRQRQPGGLQLSAWSPTQSDFHNSQRFGAMIFDDACVSYLAPHYLAPFDRKAAELRQRARLRPGAARRLEAALAPAETALQPLRSPVARPVSAAAFGTLLSAGQQALKHLESAESDLNDAVAGLEVSRLMARLAPSGKELLAWVTPAITNNKILPTPRPPAKVSRQLSLRACRGEYEPASFVVYPLRKAVRLELRVSNLRGPQGAIKASAVDVRSVKCWYQSGGADRFPFNKGLHLLTPELLLKDDDLIRLDEVTKQDFVKLSYPDGTSKYLCISNPEGTPEEKDGSVQAMPIRDAATLQPVTIRPRTAKQFWVTVKVPGDARPGKYQGKIELSSANQVLETLPVTVEVLPFDLQPNPLESSVYFHWGITLDMEGQGTLKIGKRSPAQFKAELQNLLEHGVDNPTIGVPYKTGLLEQELKLRQEVGMRNDRFYYLVGNTWAPLTEVKDIIELAKRYGFKEYYFYGRDEAQGDELKAQRKQWEDIHSVGGKVFVAGSPGKSFPLVGDLQDLLVCYGDPTREEAALWHGNGHKIFCYANPQSGIEDPETYRRNYGLLLAVNNYDGGMTYIYYSGWNDYSIGRYRQHDFVYPTADGVIDTVQWEGYREGIDDLRYLGTLRHAIAAATTAGGPAAAEAKRAQAYLDTLDVKGDLYAVRDNMISRIIRLQALAAK
ncbi:MAG: carbohydrate-binding family 9-like protein [Armatimonadia bacterium]